jgi:quinoprotein glucose dehydrogenase
MRVRAWAAVAVGLLLGAAGAAGAAGDGDWPRFGNDPGGSQFSPLDQITPANVGKLRVAWVHRSGDVAPRGSATGWTALEVTPLKVNDTVYYCTPLNRVFALDPATGKEKWVFDPHAPGADGKPLIDKLRKAAICRHVAYWQAAEPKPGVACEKRIFRGDNNGFVYAMDADTGKSCADFGAAKGHPGYISQWDYPNNGEDDPVRGMTSGPAIVGDLLIAPPNSRDSTTNANDGFVRAFDVRSGALTWEFDPIPPEHVNETGAANVWSTVSVDPERGLVFVPTTSASTDYFGGLRNFDMPLTDATVALSAATGQPVWHYQTIRHDLFDLDLPGHPLLVTIKKNGRDIPVAIQESKLGVVFVFDRETGQPIFPIEERPAPQSDVPGEQTAATQPWPLLPEPFARQRLTEDDMWGLTPIDRAWCRREFRAMRYDGPFTPPSLKGSLIFPFGAGNWGGAAFDKVHNRLIIKGQNMAFRLKLIPKSGGDQGAGKADDPFLFADVHGTPYRAEVGLFLSPLGVPCTPPPFGTVTAIDMDSGKIAWQVPLGQSKRWGITAPEFFKWGSPNIGGPMVTAGGLVFVAASVDAKIRALDAASGKELWQAGLPAPGTAVPMSYMAGGRQYVAIAAGGNARLTDELSDALVVFALPDEAKP